MKPRLLCRWGLAVVAGLLPVTFAWADERGTPPYLEHLVDDTLQPVIEENAIPGMAVALTIRGRRYFFNYGVASKEDGRKVSRDTLFEIGSVSKTLTATLAAYAEAKGVLSLGDKASTYLPALKGSAFDEVTLLELGTYTAGGLPLQLPAEVMDSPTMFAYYRNWQPAHEPGTHRRYSNPSIGLFGYLAARSLGESFEAVMQGTLLPALGLRDTYLTVPPQRLGDYAYGYSADGRPLRVSPGVLAAEAYGVKTTAADLIGFIELNLDGSRLDEPLRRALMATHTGYHQVGAMTQGLVWELYPYPVTLDQLIAGNSPQMATTDQPVTRLDPPVPPQQDVLINKTGSTDGFGTYVAFVPSRRIGIVILANKNYPNAVRVKAAHQILEALQ